MGLFAVKTTASQEQTCANMIMSREVDDIHAALVPERITSYIIVEADTEGAIDRALEEVPHAKKVLQGQTSIREVEQFLEATSDVEEVDVDNIVRLTSGPFQGETAKVTEIDDANEKVTVELLEASVPIPVEIRGDKVKVLERDENK